MAWFSPKRLLDLPRRIVLSFADSLANFGESLRDIVEPPDDVLIPGETKTPRPIKKAERKARKARRQNRRTEKKAQRKELFKTRRQRQEIAPEAPRTGDEGGGWRLVAGNPDIISVENERGSYPTEALGMDAYRDAVNALGTEEMAALVHWYKGREPYVLYIGYPEVERDHGD